MFVIRFILYHFVNLNRGAWIGKHVRFELVFYSARWMTAIRRSISFLCFSHEFHTCHKISTPNRVRNHEQYQKFRDSIRHLTWLKNELFWLWAVPVCCANVLHLSLKACICGVCSVIVNELCRSNCIQFNCCAWQLIDFKTQLHTNEAKMSQEERK